MLVGAAIGIGALDVIHAHGNLRDDLEIRGLAGVFVGTLYLPWAWKWLAGPAVDILGSRRLGPRRVWIVAMQTRRIQRGDRVAQ